MILQDLQKELLTTLGKGAGKSTAKQDYLMWTNSYILSIQRNIGNTNAITFSHHTTHYKSDSVTNVMDSVFMLEAWISYKPARCVMKAK